MLPFSPVIFIDGGDDERGARAGEEKQGFRESAKGGGAGERGCFTGNTSPYRSDFPRLLRRFDWLLGARGTLSRVADSGAFACFSFHCKARTAFVFILLIGGRARGVEEAIRDETHGGGVGRSGRK